MKTEHAGAKNGGGLRGPRAWAKSLSRQRRRAADHVLERGLLAEAQRTLRPAGTEVAYDDDAYDDDFFFLDDDTYDEVDSLIANAEAVLFANRIPPEHLTGARGCDERQNESGAPCAIYRRR